MENRFLYEWDAEKQERNLAKHRMSLAEAWRVFESSEKLDAPSPRVTEPERRSALAYVITAQAVCMLVYVIRGDAVRCISYRKASRREREEYREYLEENRPLYE